MNFPNTPVTTGGHRHTARSESGLAYLLLLVTISSLIFFAFGTVQVTHGIATGLRNVYRALQTAQRMQGNSPYAQAALDNAAWVALLNDFPAIKATVGEQDLGDRTVTLQYDDSKLPHRAFARYRDSTSVLNNFMASAMAVFGLPGLHALSTEVEIGATSFAPVLDIYADLSASMANLPFDVGDPPPYKDLIEAYGFEVNQDPAWLSSLCGPISIADYASFRGRDGLSDDDTILQREVCMLRRAALPFFYSPLPARPEGYAYSDPPTAYNLAFPGSEVVGYKRLFCGDPLAPDQFGRNYPGYRNVELNPTTCGNPSALSTPCEAFTAADSTGSVVLGDGTLGSGLFNDRDQCHTPLVLNQHWLTPAELAWCSVATPSSGTGEVFFGGRCSDQAGSFGRFYSDFFMSYKKLTQGFLIAASDIVPQLRFSVFAGASPAGNFKLAGFSGTDRQFWGTYLLYDGTENPKHLYEAEVDHTSVFTFPDLSSGPTNTIYGHLSAVYMPAPARYNHMLAYLDRENAAGHDIDLGPGTVLSVGPTAFRGSQYLMPLEHPKHPWGGVLPGRTGTLDLAAPAGSHPADSQLFWGQAAMSDFAFPAARMFFPEPKEMQPWTGSTMDTHYIDPTSDRLFKGRYAVWPLREVDGGGTQTGLPYVEENNIKNSPIAVFNYSHAMSGGTDHHAVFRKLREGHARFRASDPTNTDQTYVALVITDGESSLPCNQVVLDVVAFIIGRPGQLQCDAIENEVHYNKVVEELNSFEKIGATSDTAPGNTLTIVLFIQHEPPSANAQRFLDLFQSGSVSNTNPSRRILFTFGFADTEEFRRKFSETLGFIAVLIRTASVLTRR